MKKFAKILILLMALIAITCCFSACGNNSFCEFEYVPINDDSEYAVVGLRCSADVTDIVIPSEYNGKEVTHIGENAFYNCDSLTSITIPDSVTSIGIGAFLYCSSLNEVKYLGTIDQWAEIIFYYRDSNPLFYANNLYISDMLIEGVVLTNATKISDFAFAYYTRLTSITIPDSVTNIGYDTFFKCNALDTVTFGDDSKLESIGDYAFSGCTSLTSITIPDSVTSIGSGVFDGCNSLTIYCEAESRPSGWSGGWSSSLISRPVVWDCNNNDIADDGCNYAILDGIRYSLKGGVATVVGEPTNITSANIPSSVTYKGRTYSVTSIGGGAFSGCTALTSITIPDSVTSIGGGAFEDCTSLTAITIPDSVTSIGMSAFVYCYNLTIYCEAESKPSGWSSGVNGGWNSSNCPVVWDCNNNDIAEDGYIYTIIEGIRYSLKDGVATVVGQPTNITSANIPSSITHKGKTYLVTSIGSSAFSGCTALTSITIPDSVTSIGASAFYECTLLESIIIPESVTSIDYHAFGDYLSLTIYCEATSKPSGWDSDWNYYSYSPVVWGYKG